MRRLLGHYQRILASSESDAPTSADFRTAWPSARTASPTPSSRTGRMIGSARPDAMDLLGPLVAQQAHRRGDRHGRRGARPGHPHRPARSPAPTSTASATRFAAQIGALQPGRLGQAASLHRRRRTARRAAAAHGLRDRQRIRRLRRRHPRGDGRRQDRAVPRHGADQRLRAAAASTASSWTSSSARTTWRRCAQLASLDAERCDGDVDRGAAARQAIRLGRRWRRPSARYYEQAFAEAHRD